MNNKRLILTTIISLNFILGIAQISLAKSETTQTNNQFSRIEQPLTLKVLVTLGGLGLIGAELWWFLFSKTKSQKATLNQGIQEIEIIVDGGYNPDRIKVNLDQPVRLKFIRQDPNSCLEKVLLPDFHKAIDLPINQTTTVEFTPTQVGEYHFHCGMNMFRGIVEVQAMNPQEISTTSHNYHQDHTTKKALNATLHHGVQEMDIQVAKGYQPATIIVKAGLPVKLNFFREDANQCLATVLIPDFNITLELPLNQMVSTQFTPTQPGSYRFTCGMKMFYGTLEVQS